MIRRDLVLLVALAGSCTKQAPLSLPDVPGAKSMLLVFSDPSHEQEGIFAIDLEQPASAPLALGEEDRLFVLAYSLSLVQLGLLPGKVEIVTTLPDRPLPGDYVLYEAVAPDRGMVEIENDVFRDFMGDVRLRGFASPECEDQGGCFRLVAGQEYCMLPCTLPTVAAPMPPVPPDAPVFEPCPAGWASSLGACAPPAIAGCLAGEAQFLGEQGCLEVAGACTGRFPGDLGGDVAYVDAAVAGPGSGTEADPYRRIADALAANAAAIALAAGSYAESLAIDRPVEIAGACRNAVISGAITVRANAVLRNVRMAGTIPLTVDGSLTLRSAELSGSQWAAQVRAGGSLTAESVLIAEGSRGILAEGTSLTLTRVRVASGVGPGVAIRGGQAVLTELLISDRTTGALELGNGIEISAGSATGGRIFVAGTTDSAILVNGAGSGANLTEVVVRDPPGLWLNKHAIEIRSGGSAIVERLFVTDVGGVGVYAMAGTAEITNAVFSDIGRPALLVRAGALAASQARIERPHAFGARAANGTLSLTDVSISGVLRSRITIDGESADWDGYGVYAEQPERLALTRVAIAGATGIGVAIYGAGSADMTNVRVEDVVPREFLYGRGITMYNTPGSLNGVRIEDIDGVGLDIYAVDQTSVRTNDLSIVNVEGPGFTPSFVTVEGTRVEIDGATDSAISFDRAVVTFSDARFANTKQGVGAFVGTTNNMDYRESFFRVARARFENHPDGACLALGWYGVIEADETVLTGCRIGFDIVVIEEGRENVPEGIRFYRNERNVKVATEG